MTDPFGVPAPTGSVTRVHGESAVAAGAIAASALAALSTAAQHDFLIEYLLLWAL
jgi:hypothetical protein